VNLQSATAGYVGVVNRPVIGSLGASSGHVTNPDGTRTPTYQWYPNIPMQVQPLSPNDMYKLDGLNLTRETSSVYLNGDIDGLDRRWGQGGDLLNFGGDTWLVIGVIENWNNDGWTKVAINRQIDGVQAI